MIINTQSRSEAEEIMDDFMLEGAVLQEALDKIARINQLLGGNKLTIQGIQQLLNKKSKQELITIIDVGCGNGDMLRKIADFGAKNGYEFRLIGVDANAFTVQHAQNLSKNYNAIHYICQDIFNLNWMSLKIDIIVCTLTLHHFKNEEIKILLKAFKENATLGIVINDLHRNWLAYRLFQLLGCITQLNEMSRKDGQVSILRGFKKNELIDFAQQLEIKSYTVAWKWAFRYQWIIKNI